MDLGTFFELEDEVTCVYVGDFIATVVRRAYWEDKLVIWENGMRREYQVMSLAWDALRVDKINEILKCEKTLDSRYLVSITYLSWGISTPQLANLELLPQRGELVFKLDAHLSYEKPFLHIWPKNPLNFCNWSRLHQMQTFYEYRLLWKVFASNSYSHLPSEVTKSLLEMAFRVVLLNLIHVQQRRNTSIIETIGARGIIAKVIS